MPRRRISGLLLATLALLEGCVNAPARGPTGAAAARFSTEDYCPLQRIAATEEFQVPAPPAAVARDPERMAMWGAATRRAADAEARKTVRVSGCGDEVRFWCWAWPGTVSRSARTGRTTASRPVGWSCNEVPGSARRADFLVQP